MSDVSNVVIAVYSRLLSEERLLAVVMDDDYMYLCATVSRLFAALRNDDLCLHAVMICFSR